MTPASGARAKRPCGFQSMRGPDGRPRPARARAPRVPFYNEFFSMEECRAANAPPPDRHSRSIK
ncbi:hypothetical protein D2W70_33925 [Burkholderia pseudomallei]|nr:hypothetical protein BOC37_04715 [Burkholderia pseudomallei]RIV41021.1 hypothetical protein D2W70_33925 [Burkholderia pseudomallei]